MKDSKALVVFSGGQDSTTCLFWALRNFSAVEAISFDYGQKHQLELRAAEKIAALAGVSHQLVRLGDFSLVTKSALLGESSEIPVGQKGPGLPSTFVPGRNLLFLTYAAANAYSKGIKDLVAGVCQTDYSGYPDCRKETMDALCAALNLGMEAEFVIHTPLMFMTKAQSVKLAAEVGALEALAYSHTCYRGQFPPCGECDACLLRAKGFAEAGIDDPLLNRAVS